MDARNIAVAADKFSATSLAEAVTRARQAGFSAVTFGGNPTDHAPDSPSLDACWDDLDAAGRAKFSAARDAFARGVIHAPFRDTPLISTNRHIEAEARRQVMSAVRMAGALRLEVVTVHAPVRPEQIAPADFTRRLVACLRDLGDEAARVGTRVGVENWRYPADPDEHVALLDAVAHPAVGATLDVGHIAYWYRRDGITSLTGPAAIADYNARLERLIDALGARILHLHVHDVLPDPLDDHRLVGSGIIDYPPILERLAGRGFDGLLLLELKESPLEPAAVLSRDRLLAARRRVRQYASTPVRE